jgi:ketosteroid isomerase-like protein
VEIVRTLWAAIERDADTPWPPPPEELKRQLRLELFDEEVELRNVPDWPVGSAYQGHAGVLQWAIEIWEVFSEIHHEMLELTEASDGENVVSVQRTRGRMRHTGLEADMTWAVLWTFRDGKVLRTQGYLSRREALAAAGIEA